MKLKNITAILFVLIFFSAALVSCRKDDSKKEFGFSKIFMPQAIVKSGGIDNNYPVPSGTDTSTYNYFVDKANNKLRIILGTSLSGPESGAYSVDITVNTDTVQKLLSNGTLNPSLYLAMPVAMYTLPAKLDVAQGSKAGTFQLSLDITQLKSAAYVGKFLVLAVKIANPTQYEINSGLSTTIVMVDVNKLVIGAAVNITNYLKNPGGPFVANGFMSGSTRWGNLKDWTANAAAKSHGGFGGFNSDNSGTMDMECGWGSAQILNGKIYQTITLPAGTYAFDLSGGSWSGGELFSKDPLYEVMAPNLDSLPDFNNIVGNAAIVYQALAKTQPLLNFSLTATTKVTLGVVVNYIQTEQGFKSKQVLLYSYPNHL
ncbi:MAG: hypothetical protein JWP81_478 [Ferruginibacter sp.]|nr:hypothetical protein [Ferruginibacter sp.]